jgi:hypothetical protein
MEDSLKLKKASKAGISLRLGFGSKEKTVKVLKVPNVSVSGQKTGFENPLGNKFTVFALAFNAFGLATLSLGGVSIGGNALAAEAVLGSSIVCLSAYLLRSIIGNRGKRI